MSKLQQLLHLSRYSIAWCISPFELYALNLVKPNARPLDFVFDTETSGFHKIRNKDHVAADKAKALLQDKYEFAEGMKARGIPTVPTSRVHDDPVSPSTLTDIFPEHLDEVFCKSRFGSGGRAAFSANRNDRNLFGRTLAGKILRNREMVESAWKKLCTKGEAILQPALKNHPRCARLTEEEGAITVRLVTTKSICKIPENAQLEISRKSKAPNGKLNSMFFVIDFTTGILDISQDLNLYIGNIQETLENLQSETPLSLPFWEEIIEHSKNMQKNDFDLWAVAWDWIITPTGPILLEGNSEFRLRSLQLHHGGLLNLLNGGATPT